MNDIAKTSIKDKLIIALEKESLSKTLAGELLGVKSQYLSMALRPSQWNKFPESTWETLLKWVNSGLTIKKYAEKNGVLVAKTPEKIIAPEKKSNKKSNVVLVGIVNDPKDQKLEQKEKLTLIDLLKERRASLIEETNAIDNLLRHMIS